MSSVAEHELTLTDEQIQELLNIPEIRAAFDRYMDTKEQFRTALIDRIRAARIGDPPDVADIAVEFRADLERQEAQFQRLVLSHIQ